MADPSNEPASSSGVSEQVAATTAATAHATPIREDLDKPEDFPEPDKKRRRTLRAENDAAKTEQKLEHRLGGILCCAVCLDLPRAAVYQVSRLNLPPLRPFPGSACSANDILVVIVVFGKDSPRDVSPNRRGLRISRRGVLTLMRIIVTYSTLPLPPPPLSTTSSIDQFTSRKSVGFSDDSITQ